MPVTISFRLDEGHQAHEIALDKLKAQIASGDIGPNALVCDRVLTNGEWWSLDNLNLFHAHSTVHHEAGVHLRKKRQLQAESQYAQKVRADWAKKVFAGLPDAFVDTCLGFEPLKLTVHKPEVVGVSRLVRLPAFGGVDGVTIIFKQREAQVRIATSSKNPERELVAPVIEHVNCGIPDWGLLAKEFLEENVETNEKRLPIHSLCPPLNNWLDAKAAVRLAGDCTTPTLDGCSYIHGAADRGWNATSTWQNPLPDLTPVHAQLVGAYKTLLPSFIR